ncbi:MAG: toprim domain-containing protein [Gammaproteobacteria bacterium]|nr:toprim domain-containing protein [Gammaproteobacteria bacterium]
MMALAHRWRPVQPPRDFSDFGIEVPVGAAGEVRVPCPVCGPTHRHPRDKVVAVNVGRGIWKCHRCDWRGSLWIRRVPDPVRHEPPPPPPPPDARKAQRLAVIWRESAPLTDPRAEVGLAYLRARGLGALVDAGDLPGGDVLRLHPRLPYFETSEAGRLVGTFPALVARVLDPEGRPASLHRTWLAADGSGKADVGSPKKLASPARVNALRGAAIRLWPATDRLAVCEGGETACAVRVLTGIPVWSAVSAHGLETLMLPPGLAELTVAGDNDPHGVGERAAHRLAQRAQREGIPTVTVSIPKRVGDDWLDVLNRRSPA